MSRSPPVKRFTIPTRVHTYTHVSARVSGRPASEAVASLSRTRNGIRKHVKSSWVTSPRSRFSPCLRVLRPGLQRSPKGNATVATFSETTIRETSIAIGLCRAGDRGTILSPNRHRETPITGSPLCTGCSVPIDSPGIRSRMLSTRRR